MDRDKRHQLWLLYSILDAVKPKGGYGRAVRILEGGFEAHYDDLQGVLDDPVTGGQSEFLHGLLGRLEALRDSLDAHGIDDEDLRFRSTFRGFDYNRPEELHLSRYAEFLFAEGSWQSQKPAYGLNSHAPVLDWYRTIEERFADYDAGRNYGASPLSEAELRRILAPS